MNLYMIGSSRLKLSSLRCHTVQIEINEATEERFSSAGAASLLVGSQVDVRRTRRLRAEVLSVAARDQAQHCRRTHMGCGLLAALFVHLRKGSQPGGHRAWAGVSQERVHLVEAAASVPWAGVACRGSHSLARPPARCRS